MKTGILLSLVLVLIVSCAPNSDPASGQKVSYPLGADCPEVRSFFGDWRTHNGLRRAAAHNGLDILAPVGTPVYAVADGTVWAIDVGVQPDGRSGGTYVVLRHEPDDFGKRSGDVTTSFRSRYHHVKASPPVASKTSVDQLDARRTLTATGPVRSNRIRKATCMPVCTSSNAKLCNADTWKVILSNNRAPSIFIAGVKVFWGNLIKRDTCMNILQITIETTPEAVRACIVSAKVPAIRRI